MTRISASQLHRYSTAVLNAAGYPRPIASAISDQMVGASLRGVDSHGVSVLLPFHASEALDGRVIPDAEPVTDHSYGSTSTMDAQRAPAVAAMMAAERQADAMSRQYGTAAVAIRNLGYMGDLYHFVEPWARRGQIAMLMANSEAEVAPHLGRQPLHGTNPIAFAFPNGATPVVVDMRTNSLRRAEYWASILNETPLPEGGAITQTMEPLERPEDLASGVLLPLAGAKGYALAVVVDLMTAALAGGSIGTDLTFGDTVEYSTFLWVLNLKGFGGNARFEEIAERLSRQARSIPPMDDSRPVQMPGDRSAQVFRTRSRDGIPLDARWYAMGNQIETLGISTPPLPIPPET